MWLVTYDDGTIRLTMRVIDKLKPAEAFKEFEISGFVCNWDKKYLSWRSSKLKKPYKSMSQQLVLHYDMLLGGKLGGGKFRFMFDKRISAEATEAFLRQQVGEYNPDAVYWTFETIHRSAQYEIHP